MNANWPAHATLETLGTIVVCSLAEEAEFLAKYQSNWGNHGLPGRRELHVVSVVAHQLRARYGVRSILEDDYMLGGGGENYGRCDLALQLDQGDGPGSWAWLEIKTMPWSDANDKLGGKGNSVHDDLEKLDRAARGSGDNLPQAIVVVGYGRDADEPHLQHRFHHLAAQHRLDLWPVRLGASGVVRFELPTVNDPQPYTHCVVGYWGRTTFVSEMSEHGCGRECGSIRAARHRHAPEPGPAG